jgi:DNA-binding GntR family transcriptional regulator
MEHQDGGAPLYRRISEALHASIQSGEYPAGSLLPTEIEIAEQFDVSRHTVRDALRILSNAGIVRRRRRIGTVVLETQAGPPDFVQPLRGYEEVLQYARDARLLIDTYGPAPRTGLVRRLGLDAAEWMRVEGRRSPAARPVGLVTILMRADCAPGRQTLEAATGSVSELIEAATGIETSRIEQEISAAALNRRAAHALVSAFGSPALRTTRRYFDAAQRLFLAAETLHPADRFSYAMTYNRRAAERRLAA